MQPKTPLFTSGSQHPPRFGHAVYLGDYCPKTIEATILKKVPNESKLIYAINILIVASRFLLFSYGSNLNANTN